MESWIPDIAIRSLRDIEAIERVPFTERVAYRNVLEMLSAAASRTPDSPAIIYLPAGDMSEPAQTVSYREFIDAVRRCANLFSAHGVGPGDTVSFMLPNIPQAHYVMWGAEVAGIAGPINPALSAQYIADLLVSSRTRVLVVPSPKADPDLWAKIDSIRHLVPGLQAIFQVGPEVSESGLVRDFDRHLPSYPKDRLTSGRTIAPDDIAAYFHTGGTTGAPKLAQHSHRGQVHMAWALALHSDTRPGDRLMQGLPLFHVAGLIHNGLMPLSSGASIVQTGPTGYRNKSVFQSFWKIIEHYHVTSYMCVPTIHTALLDIPLDGADVSSLRSVFGGTAAAPAALISRTEERLGVKFLEGYGLTEVTSAAAVNPRDGERRVGSIGLRLAYQDMKTVKLSSDGMYLRDCDDNEIGTLVIRGPNVFPGYVQEDKNRDIWVADRWLNTGDLARRDADGYFYITGRSKDLIIRGGHNIYPSIIEDALHKHPDVVAAAAVGKPDAYAGELPIAYVVLRPGASVTPEALKLFAREHIDERGAAPVDITALDAMPLTAVGKVAKPALRRDAVRRAFADVLAPVAGRVAALEVAVDEDSKLGMVASIHVTVDAASRAQVQTEIERLLAPYPIGSRITVDS